MCMFALTVSIVEPKNIKEAMADSAWIEAMQEELHQFDRLQVWECFTKGIIDPTLFTIKYGEDILLVQIYVDDIIFGSTNPKFSKRFEKLMHGRFEMSLMGEMKFFLGLQIHQIPSRHSYQAHPYSVSLHKGNKVENGKMPTKTDANAGTIFQQGVSNDVLKRVNTYAVRITMLIADIEEESLDPDNIKMEMVMHHSAGKSNSLPHAHAQTTKTYYKHPRLRFMKSS
ncbi:retrovirus-related pol polyprotein from transposon TNT 1-94 [Tanacetum coccineum]